MAGGEKIISQSLGKLIWRLIERVGSIMEPSILRELQIDTYDINIRHLGDHPYLTPGNGHYLASCFAKRPLAHLSAENS